MSSKRLHPILIAISILVVALAIVYVSQLKPQPTSPSPSPSPTDEQSGEAEAHDGQFSLRVGETQRFDNGGSVTLEKINDSRCKPDVVCIWAGELGRSSS